MITVSQAIDVFKKKYPNLTKIKVFNYDDDSYMINACRNGNEINDPFYIIDKNTGAFKSTPVMSDMGKFLAALNNPIS